jgi:hypothetical protein
MYFFTIHVTVFYFNTYCFLSVYLNPHPSLSPVVENERG